MAIEIKLEAPVLISEDRKISTTMTISSSVNTFVQITNADFQAGFEEKA